MQIVKPARIPRDCPARLFHFLEPLHSNRGRSVFRVQQKINLRRQVRDGPSNDLPVLVHAHELDEVVFDWLAVLVFEIGKTILEPLRSVNLFEPFPILWAVIPDNHLTGVGRLFGSGGATAFPGACVTFKLT